MAVTVENIGERDESPERQEMARVLGYRAVATIVMSIGFLCPLVGIILFLIHSLVSEDHALNGIGSGLLVASIPLLLTGSHLLDKADEKSRG